MAWLFAALILSVSLGISAVWDRPAAASAGDRLRIATFNIHKGADRRNRYDLERTIEAIAALDADVVGIQEALRNDPAFGCDDQPALIAAGLARLTRRPWTYSYARAWITENRDCLRRGTGDDVASEGLALFARERLVGPTALRLSEGRIGLSARLASMPYLPLVVTHLSANRNSQPDRAREIGTLMPWAQRRGAMIVMGDLNAAPDADELTPLLAGYRDAWSDAALLGLARGQATGATRPGRRGARIDYVFYAARSGLILESVDVPEAIGSFDVMEVSDHRPVVATFRLGGEGR